EAHGEGRRVERLELDEQLVDDAGDPFPAGGGPHAGASGADGVDLFDEADRTTLAASRLAEGAEVGADLAVGLAVVHRLERRRRDEEEGDAGLLGHGLR